MVNKWQKVVKSGISSPGKVWKSWSVVTDTKWNSKTLEMLCKLGVSVFRFFEMDLTNFGECILRAD